MEKKQLNEKNCRNCRYYSQHYSKQGTKYHIVFCGHCLHINNKKSSPCGMCELWEDITIEKEERRKSIKETLESMSVRLDEIAMILKDDAE